mgnify:CR=1 FL=1
MIEVINLPPAFAMSDFIAASLAVLSAIARPASVSARDKNIKVNIKPAPINIFGIVSNKDRFIRPVKTPRAVQMSA